jgi:hypothetical protein
VYLAIEVTGAEAAAFADDNGGMMYASPVRLPSLAQQLLAM